MDYKQNTRYFKKKIPVWLIIVIAILLAFPTFGFSLLIGIVMVIIRMIPMGKIPSDQEIDQVAEEEFKGAMATALNKWGIEDEEVGFADPIIFRGWAYAGASDTGRRTMSDVIADKLFDVEGKDKKWRSPVMEIHVFAFSEDMVHYYAKYISLVSDATQEKTDEFFYKDIVSAKTETINKPAMAMKAGVPIPVPGKNVKWDCFTLTTTGGTSVACSVRDSDTADTSVKAMRTLLKQKKK